MRTLIVALLALASSAGAQITKPIGTLQPKVQTPPVLAVFDQDTVSESAWIRAPFDTVLKAVGSRFVCAKPGLGYALKRYNKSANKKTTAIYADTLVFDCFPKGYLTPTRPAPDTTVARMGTESRRAVQAEACSRAAKCADTIKPPTPKKPPI